MGNMQLLQLKSDKLDIREMRLIDNAVAALKNQLGILDNISDSVKIAVGTRAFQSEATNVDEIITREVNLLLIQEPSKTCIYNPQNQRLTANADKKLLNRVFHNVFEHVRLNTLRGAKILIKSSTDEKRGQIRIEIMDDGEALLSENFEPIFDLLSKLDLRNMGGRWDNGNLLGFSKILLRQMRGDITALDNNGVGAKFVITLPLTDTD